jgi:hypothetical protein
MTPLSMSINVMRMIQLAAHRKLAKTLEVNVQADVAHHLLNKKRREILKWEDEGAMTVGLNGRAEVSPEFLEVRGFDNNGHEVPMPGSAAPPPPRAPEKREERDERGGERGGDRGGRGGSRGGPRGGRGGRGR